MSATADFQIGQPVQSSAAGAAALAWAAAYFCYALFVYWTYVEIIQPVFYWELKISENPVNPLTGALIATLVSFFTPKKFAKPSDVVLMFAFAVHIVPVLMISPHYDNPLAYSLVIGLSYSLVCILASAKTINFPPMKGGTAIFVAFAILCMMVTFAGGVQSGTLSLSNFSLSSIYETRAVEGTIIRGGLVEYITGWTANLLIMALIVMAVLRQRYVLGAALLVAQLSMFLVTSEKLTLFIPFFGLIAYCAFESRLAPRHLLAGMFALIATGAVLALQYDFQLLNFLIVRRIFFTPASLDSLYPQVFDVYGFQYWAQFLSRFTGDAGGPPPAVVVGALITNSTGELSNAGTGYIGSGYMQAGYAGMLFYAVIIGIFLYLANCLAAGRIRTSLATVVTFYPVWAALNDSDLPTAFLTQGIFIALCSLWLLGRAPDGVDSTK